MNSFSNATMSIGEKIKGHTNNLKSLLAVPKPGAAAQARKIAILVAKDIDDYTSTVEESLPELENSVEHYIENYTGYVRWFPVDSDENMQEFLKWRDTLNNLREATGIGLTGISSFRDSVRKLSGSNREINKSSQQLSLVLDGVINAIEKIEAFCAKSLLLIDEKLEKKAG